MAEGVTVHAASRYPVTYDWAFVGMSIRLVKSKSCDPPTLTIIEQQ